MTRAELAKIFNDVDATFSDSEIFKEIITDVDANLRAGKPKEVILVDAAFELSKRFMFEIMHKALCDVESGH